MVSPVAASVSATGITAPTFAEILSWLQDQYRSIFGLDAYIAPDSQDGQLIATFAQALADGNAAAVAAYNAFSPTTSQGNGLSSVVKINGLLRALPSPSTCDLTLVGVAGTTITNGQATDANNITWLLPASVTIPNSGTITVTATCATQGAIAASIGSVTKIKTPTFGWQTVTNAAIAVVGNPVETDAALRVRQSQSVASPSTTILDGVMGSIAGLLGVTRCKGYENNTKTTDGNGITANSVAIFAEGGDPLSIATVIAQKMTPGTTTIGNITNTIISAKGSSRVANFARPTAAVIHVALTVKALTGWSTSIEPIIAQAICDFINALPIGQNVHYFDVSVPAKIPGSNYASSFLLSAMTLAKNAGGASAADVTIAYNEAPACIISNVTFTVT